jgi:hypothetical protein
MEVSLLNRPDFLSFENMQFSFLLPLFLRLNPRSLVIKKLPRIDFRLTFSDISDRFLLPSSGYSSVLTGHTLTPNSPRHSTPNSSPYLHFL